MVGTRNRLGLTMLGVAGTLAAVLSACSSSGSSKVSSAPAPIATTQPTPVKTTVALPANFPDGTFGHAGKPQDRLTLTRDGAVAALKDQYGISTQNLTSSSTGTITFGGDPGYCATAGTYHYTVHGATLTFRVVSDSCGSRRDLLTPPWRRV